MIPMVLLLAFIAVTGIIATALGWIAVAQIRGSGGKLRGLRLAVFDGLFFPLLLLDAAVLRAIYQGFGFQAAAAYASRHAHLDGIPPVPAFTITYNVLVLLGLGALVVLNVFIVRVVWRYLSAPGNAVRASDLKMSMLALGAGGLVLALCLAGLAMNPSVRATIPAPETVRSELSTGATDDSLLSLQQDKMIDLELACVEAELQYRSKHPKFVEFHEQLSQFERLHPEIRDASYRVKLRLRWVALEADLAGLSTRYGPKHPRRIAVEKQMGYIDALLAESTMPPETAVAPVVPSLPNTTTP